MYKEVIKMNNLIEKNIEDLTLEEMEEIKEKFREETIKKHDREKR